MSREAIAEAVAKAIAEHGALVVKFAFENITVPIMPFVATILREQELVALGKALKLTDEEADAALRLYSNLKQAATSNHHSFLAGQQLVMTAGTIGLDNIHAAIFPNGKGN